MVNRVITFSVEVPGNDSSIAKKVASFGQNKGLIGYVERHEGIVKGLYSGRETEEKDMRRTLLNYFNNNVNFDTFDKRFVSGEFFDFKFRFPIPKRMYWTHNEMKSAVIVVDPYSSAQYVVDALIERGDSVVGVFSNYNLAKQFESSAYTNKLLGAFVINEGEDPSEFLEFISKYVLVITVMPGAESGIILYDKLSYLAGTLRNVKTKGLARRDKFTCQDELRKNGVRAIKQVLTYTTHQAVTAAERISYPVVIKPTLGSGSIGVWRCNNKESLEIAYKDTEAISKVKSLAIAPGVVVQEFLQGQEYVVDTISYEGDVIITAIYTYRKSSRGKGIQSFAYDAEVFVPWDNSPNSITRKLKEYILKVLPCLGVIHGPGHAEVMVNNGECCLVEFGARVQGGVAPVFQGILCGKTSTVPYYLVDIFRNKGKLFKRIYKEIEQGFRFPYLSPLSGIYVDLQSSENSTLLLPITQSSEPLLAKLPTFKLASPQISPGGKLVPTKDLNTVPMSVLLVGKASDILDDYKQLKSWEASGELWFTTKTQNQQKKPSCIPTSSVYTLFDDSMLLKDQALQRLALGSNKKGDTRRDLTKLSKDKHGSRSRGSSISKGISSSRSSTCQSWSSTSSRRRSSCRSSKKSRQIA